jgi:hypothetical protein
LRDGLLQLGNIVVGEEAGGVSAHGALPSGDGLTSRWAVNAIDGGGLGHEAEIDKAGLQGKVRREGALGFLARRAIQPLDQRLSLLAIEDCSAGPCRGWQSVDG